MARPGGLGSGTRNYVVIMAVTSEASSYVRALEELSRKKWGTHPSPDTHGCSGIVAVALGAAGASDASADTLISRVGRHIWICALWF